MYITSPGADPRLLRLMVFGLLFALACVLYVPYLGNPLMFDDVNIFHTSEITRAATAPWELGPRGLPYFTLGWVETQIGTMQAHRLVSLALHVTVGYQLYRLLERLLFATESEARPPNARPHLVGAMVAAIFICHPAATYGAAYLVQRTSVLSALFAILCLRNLLAAFMEGNRRLAAIAAGWASLAILSKEHSVVVPIAALALALVTPRIRRETIATGAVFLAICVPAMALALGRGFYAVGTAYEPAMQMLEGEVWGLPQFTGRFEQWLFSASVQAGLYFEYWGQWLVPRTENMSIDLRVDFLAPWSHADAWLRLGFFLLAPIVGLLAWRAGRSRLIAFALVFTAAAFVVELGTVRFQEPYVLYRSYVWSVGYAVAAATLLYSVPPRIAAALTCAVVPLLLVQARDRLQTMQTPLALWEDAAAKLAKTEVAGASRIFFNRGRALYVDGDLHAAKRDIDLAIHLNPAHGRYRVARAATYLKLGQPLAALEDLSYAQQSLPADGALFYTRFVALRALNRPVEADAALAIAAQHGNSAAQQRLRGRRASDDHTAIDFGGQP